MLTNMLLSEMLFQKFIGDKYLWRSVVNHESSLRHHGCAWLRCHLGIHQDRGLEDAMLLKKPAQERKMCWISTEMGISWGFYGDVIGSL